MKKINIISTVIMKINEKKDQKIINCLYSYFKTSPKKLKIICDWDEIIQPHEPYALWLANRMEKERNDSFVDYKEVDFATFFEIFWSSKEVKIDYSSYGSKIKEASKQQIEIKNSPNFYQEAPFLSIAKELLMLIKADKVEKLIFLSAYDKRKFPNGDQRKVEIFADTFGKLDKGNEKGTNINLRLIGFDSEEKGDNKADWIKKNASDFDILIDDNPLICKSIAESFVSKIKQINSDKNVCTPYYPSVAKQHHPNVILIKTSISNLTKKDFN